MNSSNSHELLERLVDEFVERRRRGECPTVEEYVARYPELASAIQDVLPALALMEQVAPGSSDLEPFSSAGDLSEGPPIAKIGNYRILREIGRGGMGVVYEAEQLSLGRRVALKVLYRQSVGHARSLTRFRREARAAARMHHSNIVPVFEVGNDQEHAFYAMQLISGQGLDQVIRDLRRLRAGNRKGTVDSEGPRSLSASQSDEHASSVTNERIAKSLLTGRFDVEELKHCSDDDAVSPVHGQTTVKTDVELAETATHEHLRHPTSAVLPGERDLSSVETDPRAYYMSVAQIGLQVAKALAYAHARGIIHRDVKPSNLLLDTAGTVWIVDFGLAKSADESLTNTGDLVGTIGYMAPERFRGMCDVRADIYSLGLTLYELLSLRPAFSSSDHLGLIDKIKNQNASPLRFIDPNVPRDLETIVLKSMDKDAKLRYQSADEMADDLDRLVRDEPIKARRVSTIERLGRWSRRNRSMAAALGSIALLLTVGAIASLAVTAYVQSVNSFLRRELYAHTWEVSARVGRWTILKEWTEIFRRRGRTLSPAWNGTSCDPDTWTTFPNKQSKFMPLSALLQ